MLELSGVNVHYGKIHVLRDVSLRVETGEVAALIGPNAAGKTTTLRALVGLKDCASGVIRFGTQPIQRLSTPDRIRLGIASSVAMTSTSRTEPLVSSGSEEIFASTGTR